jgi:hypothetical protein
MSDANDSHSKIGASFANTSSMIVGGMFSSLRALREARSRARGWSHRMTPVVVVPAPVKDTAKPAVRAKPPPLVIGNTTGVLVSRLKAVGDTTKTAVFPVAHDLKSDPMLVWETTTDAFTSANCNKTSVGSAKDLKREDRRLWFILTPLRLGKH